MAEVEEIKWLTGRTVFFPDGSPCGTIVRATTDGIAFVQISATGTEALIQHKGLYTMGMDLGTGDSRTICIGPEGILTYKKEQPTLSRYEILLQGVG